MDISIITVLKLPINTQIKFNVIQKTLTIMIIRYINMDFIFK